MLLHVDTASGKTMCLDCRDGDEEEDDDGIDEDEDDEDENNAVCAECNRPFYTRSGRAVCVGCRR